MIRQAFATSGEHLVPATRTREAVGKARVILLVCQCAPTRTVAGRCGDVATAGTLRDPAPCLQQHLADEKSRHADDDNDDEDVQHADPLIHLDRAGRIGWLAVIDRPDMMTGPALVAPASRHVGSKLVGFRTATLRDGTAGILGPEDPVQECDHARENDEFDQKRDVLHCVLLGRYALLGFNKQAFACYTTNVKQLVYYTGEFIFCQPCVIELRSCSLSAKLHRVNS